ncbi:MAG: hypothetical protein LBF16_00920 [Pseudomonadales bacterium]|jgi:hypothetical protein|nr:hypothetical protein [Pseudomonadales bacterium]
MKIRNAIAAITGTWASRYHTALILLPYLAIPISANAQNILGASVEPPESVRRGTEAAPKELSTSRDISAIRSEQRRLAAEAGIEIQEFEQEGRSVSSLNGVPPEIKDIEVIDEKTLNDFVIPIIYKYYGFTGTETLRFSRKTPAMGYVYYSFKEYINGIESPGNFAIRVDPKSKRISNVGGGLAIDKGYDTRPKISEQEAINLVIDFIKDEENEKGYSLNDTNKRAAITTKVIYVVWEKDDEGYAPAWQIEIPMKNATDFDDAREPYIVYPDGTIGTTRGYLAATNVRVCDGSSATEADGYPYCG